MVHSDTEFTLDGSLQKCTVLLEYRHLIVPRMCKRIIFGSENGIAVFIKKDVAVIIMINVQDLPVLTVEGNLSQKLTAGKNKLHILAEALNRHIGEQLDKHKAHGNDHEEHKEHECYSFENIFE